MELVAFLGDDKENWGQVTALINRMPDVEKIILVKNKSSPNFPKTEKCKLIEIDSTQPLAELKSQLHSLLSKEISKEFEVSLSLASGNGKEHMALISALLSVPVGIKLVVYSKKGIEFLT
ncbi:hypothetical protein J4402_01880 [Candidatus Pacearchaeota archaeon]|nr:hypothetical protein [uncultured archaeon]AQS31814.1 hypothetical protein [uncultured archaeon]MBS3088508.1 hypothetical protein [Candidatus Pacearchaeota archaeon]